MGAIFLPDEGRGRGDVVAGREADEALDVLRPRRQKRTRTVVLLAVSARRGPVVVRPPRQGPLPRHAPPDEVVPPSPQLLARHDLVQDPEQVERRNAAKGRSAVALPPGGESQGPVVGYAGYYVRRRRWDIDGRIFVAIVPTIRQMVPYHHGDVHEPQVAVVVLPHGTAPPTRRNCHEAPVLLLERRRVPEAGGGKRPGRRAVPEPSPF